MLTYIYIFRFYRSHTHIIILSLFVSSGIYKQTMSCAQSLYISGPCSKIAQYKEIQNVRIWVQCLTALTGRDEDDLLLELHREFSDSNKVSYNLCSIHLRLLSVMQYVFIGMRFKYRFTMDCAASEVRITSCRIAGCHAFT